MVFKNISLQLSLPVPGFLPKAAQLPEKITRKFETTVGTFKGYFFSFVSRLRSISEKRRLSAESRSTDFQERKSRFQMKKFIKPAILVSVLVVAFIFGVRMLGNKGDVAGDQAEIGAAEKTLEINKEFSFPLKNDAGEEVAKVKYLVEKAELRDEIIVQGKRATAVKGRTFIILNLKVSNEFTQSIEINTKDYIRLSVNGNEEEWLAPDIHNDPVTVQAISTKYSRVGFPINDSDTNLVIRVGEIEGEKELIPLEFN